MTFDTIGSRSDPVKSEMTLWNHQGPVEAIQARAQYKPLLVYVITRPSGGSAVTFRDASGEVYVEHMLYHINLG